MLNSKKRRNINGKSKRTFSRLKETRSIIIKWGKKESHKGNTHGENAQKVDLSMCIFFFFNTCKKQKKWNRRKQKAKQYKHMQMDNFFFLVFAFCLPHFFLYFCYCADLFFSFFLVFWGILSVSFSSLLISRISLSLVNTINYKWFIRHLT